MTRDTIGLALALLELAATALGGLVHGPRELRQATTTPTLVLAALETVYGVLSPVAAFGLVRRHRWTMPVVVVWVAACTGAATFASWYYAEPGRRAANAVPAGVATLIVTGFVVWMARRRQRDASAPLA